MAARIHRRRGLTLAEVAISTLLVGVVLAAAMNTVGGVLKTRNVTVEAQVGPALARDLMSEVLQNAFTDPEAPDGPIGTETGESTTTRADFDDVDDYNGWNKPSPVNSDGTALGYGTGWQRQVSVGFVNPNTLTTNNLDTGLKLIVVTVTASNGNTTVLQTLRSRLGSVERLPIFDRTFVTGSQLEIQTSGASTDIVSGTSIKNHGSDQ